MRKNIRKSKKKSNFSGLQNIWKGFLNKSGISKGGKYSRKNLLKPFGYRNVNKILEHNGGFVRGQSRLHYLHTDVCGQTNLSNPGNLGSNLVTKGGSRGNRNNRRNNRRSRSNCRNSRKNNRR
jgi:hypothetical protein